MAMSNPGPVPRTFWEYLRSFGPGFVVVLTWLGAGDIVETGVAGGNYGYALMWVIVVALVMRFLFVSLIAKYQLCNERGEAVLDGLVRLHPWYAPALLVTAVVMGHVYGSYMAVGVGQTWVRLTGQGQTWQWAMAWTAITMALVFRPAYRRIERVFGLFLVLLSASLVGTALWVGPSPRGILRGTLGFALPQQQGPFGALLVTIGMLGAIGGSLMNLVYPYFLEQKGWRGPAFRRVQFYDFLLAVLVMVVLDLAVWTLGAELVHARQEQIADLDDLAGLLSEVLGAGGAVLFHLGVFAAVFTSLVGHALGLGCLGTHAYLRWIAPAGPIPGEYSSYSTYRWIVLWVLLSPLIWTLPGMPEFVTLTLVANSIQVVLTPFLAGGLWWITASSRYIGLRYRNRWWENLVMAALFALALWGAKGSIESVVDLARGG